MHPLSDRDVILLSTLWRDRWQSAYEGASFYRSVQNTTAYWDGAAENGGAGLSGNEHLEILYSALSDVLHCGMTLLDAGCGGGEYVIRFADCFERITAADSSEKMTELCKRRCGEKNISNVTYLNCDYMDIPDEQKYDVVFSCLNPASYCPSGFEKLLGLAEKTVVYLSMDTPPDRTEPVYNGTNTVQITERYLEERGIAYRKIPFTYMDRIPFAYLIVYKQG